MPFYMILIKHLEVKRGLEVFLFWKEKKANHNMTAYVHTIDFKAALSNLQASSWGYLSFTTSSAEKYNA